YQLSYTSSSNSRTYVTRRVLFCQQDFSDFLSIFLGGSHVVKKPPPPLAAPALLHAVWAGNSHRMGILVL
ncbi:hypothetical protein, partial [uncultured Oscillibacter sp.]|uniref:hypothetical protein n=1 Tax=uncultured Oscillibacter sp. TaxID=876091 RepID=UPI00280B73A8